MEIRSLRYFVAVVTAGSLTAAAAELHLSQPSLSVAIRRLETTLGVALLNRTTRGVEPTAAGRRLLSGATQLIAQLDELDGELRRYGEGIAGSISLAAVPVLMLQRIPTLLRIQAAAAPNVEVRLSEPPPWQTIDMLRQRAVDVAAVVVAEPRRFVQQYRHEFEIVDWGDIPLVAAIPPGEASRPDPLPLQAFDGHLVLLPRRSSAVRGVPELVEEAFVRHNITPSEVRTVDSIHTSVPLIEAGLAWGILPDPDRSSLGGFQVEVRALDPEPRALRAFVLARTGASRDTTIAGLLERAAAMIPSPPG